MGEWNLRAPIAIPPKQWEARGHTRQRGVVRRGRVQAGDEGGAAQGEAAAAVAPHTAACAPMPAAHPREARAA
eukprot:scaffold108770_cov30-Tisochrysis_lutea.AAC.1